MENLLVNKIRTKEELESAFAVRTKVFVEEQAVDSNLERENDDVSVHFLATLDMYPCAACRYRKTTKGYKLERFAVLKEYRGKGLGQALVAAVLTEIPHDGQPVYLHAQRDAVGLYLKFGFVIEGEEFEEAKIKHFMMVKR